VDLPRQRFGQSSVNPPVPQRDWTIAETRSAIVRGDVSAEELTRHHLDRIADLDGALNAMVTLDGGALAVARRLDDEFRSSRTLMGPLHGVPVVVKDNFETAGIATSFGSKAFSSYVPSIDATVVARLRGAGAVVIGKTTMPDFAASWHGHSSRSGVTRNPHDPRRDPGGSSGGTAAAVAAGLGVAGVGTDTGGSIRVPASFCGVVGLRPTPGLVSRAGVIPLIADQDSPGPIARTVSDAAVLLDVIAGWDEADPTTAVGYQRPPCRYAESLTAGGLRGARVGVLRWAFGDDSESAEADVNAVIETALADMRAAGAELIDPIEMPKLTEDLADTLLYFHQSRQDINAFLATRDLGSRDVADVVAGGGVWPTMVLMQAIAAGPENPYTDPSYAAKRARRDALFHGIAAVFARHRLDAVGFPDVRIAAPLRSDIDAGRWEEAAQDAHHPRRSAFPVNTAIASQARMPAITVPAGFTSGGLPVGLEFLGLRFSELTLLRLAHDYELFTRHRRAPQPSSARSTHRRGTLVGPVANADLHGPHRHTDADVEQYPQVARGVTRIQRLRCRARETPSRSVRSVGGIADQRSGSRAGRDRLR
jgi:amidase